jgi:hypothetical protein
MCLLSLEILIVLDKACEFVFVDVKHNAHSSLNTAYLAHVVSHSWFPVFAQNLKTRMLIHP